MTPIVIAHRGASERAPENTVEAFGVARDLGSDWVELDVRRCADGVIVVHHDALLADGRLIADLSAAELPSTIPSLAEALEACAGMGVHIEIKNLPDDPDFDRDNVVSDAVAGLARAYLDPDQVLVSSFTMSALDEVRRVDPELPTAWLFFESISPPLVIERACDHGLAAINPYADLVDAAFVTRAHEAGLGVRVWTVDEPDRIAALAEMGVDGIVTNVPDVALRALGR